MVPDVGFGDHEPASSDCTPSEDFARLGLVFVKSTTSNSSSLARDQVRFLVGVLGVLGEWTVLLSPLEGSAAGRVLLEAMDSEAGLDDSFVVGVTGVSIEWSGWWCVVEQSLTVPASLTTIGSGLELKVGFFKGEAVESVIRSLTCGQIKGSLVGDAALRIIGSESGCEEECFVVAAARSLLERSACAGTSKAISADKSVLTGDRFGLDFR